MSEENKKETLSDYIDKHYKLFTALGVCLAVTMFAKNIPIKFFSYSISLIFFFLAFLIVTEMFMKLRSSGGSIKIVILENLLLWAVVLLALDLLIEHTIPIIVVIVFVLTIVIPFSLMHAFPSLRVRDNKILFYKNNKFSISKTIIYCLFVSAVIVIGISITAILVIFTYKIFGKSFLEMKDYFINVIK